MVQNIKGILYNKKYKKINNYYEDLLNQKKYYFYSSYYIYKRNKNTFNHY